MWEIYHSCLIAKCNKLHGYLPAHTYPCPCKVSMSTALESGVIRANTLQLLHNWKNDIVTKYKHIEMAARKHRRGWFLKLIGEGGGVNI